MLRAMRRTAVIETSETPWKVNLNRLRQELAASKFEETLNVGDFKSFHKALQSLFDTYSRSSLQRLIGKLEPHFDHIKSFHIAVSAASQQSAVASSIWSAFLAVIEVCKTISRASRLSRESIH